MPDGTVTRPVRQGDTITFEQVAIEDLAMPIQMLPFVKEKFPDLANELDLRGIDTGITDEEIAQKRAQLRVQVEEQIANGSLVVPHPIKVNEDLDYMFSQSGNMNSVPFNIEDMPPGGIPVNEVIVTSNVSQIQRLPPGGILMNELRYSSGPGNFSALPLPENVQQALSRLREQGYAIPENATIVGEFRINGDGTVVVSADNQLQLPSDNPQVTRFLGVDSDSGISVNGITFSSGTGDVPQASPVRFMEVHPGGGLLVNEIRYSSRPDNVPQASPENTGDAE